MTDGAGLRLILAAFAPFKQLRQTTRHCKAAAIGWCPNKSRMLGEQYLWECKQAVEIALKRKDGSFGV
jgi:hypothetical protein